LHFIETTAKIGLLPPKSGSFPSKNKRMYLASVERNSVVSQLFSMCELNQFERVRQLLIDKPSFDVNEVENRSSRKALLHVIASKPGAQSLMRFLVEERSANIDVTDGTGRTPVYIAVENENFDSARYLIARGANLEKKLRDGTTALSNAAYADKSKFVQLLLENNADVKSVDNNGRTPLSRTAISGAEAACRLLLVHDANPSLADDSGWTPLFYAAINNRENICLLFLKKGVDINHRANDGRTALLWTLRSNLPFGSVGTEKLPTIRLLVDYGADINATDPTGKSALYFAYYEGYLGIVKYLSWKGAHLIPPQEVQFKLGILDTTQLALLEYCHKNRTRQILIVFACNLHVKRRRQKSFVITLTSDMTRLLLAMLEKLC
jgi:ankyrin repeat protein